MRTVMPCNTHPEFVGLERIKQAQAIQLHEFKSWAERRQWNQFHRNHYDWWRFPIDEPSSYGFAWVVYDAEIVALKKDPGYIAKYLRGVELLACLWGWDPLKNN